jgi:hypothetical protein
MTENYYIENYCIQEYKKHNIYIIESLLNDQECQMIIKIIDTLPLIKTEYSPDNNVKCFVNTINDLLKVNDELYYNFSTNPKECEILLNILKKKETPYTNNMNGITNDQILNINETINSKMKIISQIMEKVNHKINFKYNTGYILRKIYGETRLHSDGISEIYNTNVNFINNNKLGDYKMVRTASVIFSLNDNYEGGVINFPIQDVSFNFKKGSVLLFPPYWTHPHQVSELKNNTFRYTINTWACDLI